LDRGLPLGRKHASLLVACTLTERVQLEALQAVLASLYLRVQVNTEADLLYKEWLLSVRNGFDTALLLQ
jgi:hypothetical protein